jgi:hypothetical protein
MANNFTSFNPTLIDVSAPTGHCMIDNNGSDSLTGTQLILFPKRSSYKTCINVEAA